MCLCSATKMTSCGFSNDIRVTLIVTAVAIFVACFIVVNTVLHHSLILYFRLMRFISGLRRLHVYRTGTETLLSLKCLLSTVIDWVGSFLLISNELY